VIGHLRADAIRLAGRWDVRLFLLLVPIAAFGGYLASYASIDGHYGWDPSQPMPTEVAGMIAAERAGYAFPASLLTVFGNAPWLLFGLFFIASGTVGLEFAWATIKTTLMTSPSRLRFALSRMIAVGALGLAALGLLVVTGIVLPSLMPILGDALPPSRPTEPLVIGGTLAALFISSAFFVALGVLLAVITRGPALPLLILIADFMVEGILSGLPVVREAGLQLLAGSLPIMSVIGLISGAQEPTSYGLSAVPSPVPGAPPLLGERPLGLAFLVVLGWTGAFLALTAWQLRRTDVLE
jgi:hypothetical protein